MASAADEGDEIKVVSAILVMLGTIALLVLTIISATDPLGGLAFVMGIILAVFLWNWNSQFFHWSSVPWIV